jgi:hypothetical protein
MGERTAVGESHTEPQSAERDTDRQEVWTRLWEATTGCAGETVRQCDAADPDGEEGDVLVERPSSTGVPIANDEKAHEQHHADRRESE